MSEELKPCPFCGGSADAITAVGEYWILCVECGNGTCMHNTEEKAIAGWNTRTEEK